MANPEDSLSKDEQQVLLRGKRHWFWLLDIRLPSANWRVRESLENAGLLQEGSYLLTPEGRRARGRLQVAQMNANLEDHDDA
jgi:hypothetical protein